VSFVVKFFLYKELYEILIRLIDKNRIFHDPLHTLAYGTDASFYRLIPKLVIRAKDENEVSLILKECTTLKIPVTFRAAGTSLSGQAITDSVLIIAGNGWNKYSISEDASEIKMQPGVIGGRANLVLSSNGKKIGPDPASINSAMIGGIAANNASGMCCGTSENTYKTVAGIKIVFADGTLLDTGDIPSKDNFRKNHPKLISEIKDLAKKARENIILAERITRKYKMKNTTGYSLNALIDYSDPFDIIEHLMIGSEGTLGFIAEINLKTVIEKPFKASALMLFPGTNEACSAVPLLKMTQVSAVELIDSAGLRSVESEKALAPILEFLNEKTCALLVETTASEKEELDKNIEEIINSIAAIPIVTEVHFTDRPAEYELLWKIRKGLFPSVGAMRKTGTTVIIEDVAFPISSLAEATSDLQKILKNRGYNEAVIFGHALEGNLHFVFTQDFSTTEEIDRYANLMKDVADLVVNKYDGSLKAEHGTGRNMAPFVEMEWGKEAFELMKEIKRIFDPDNILNPGVILNADKNIHLKNLKPIPAASELTDKCTECGFCEPSCVSADLSLTPRQRIVIHREMTSLVKSGKDPHVAASLAKSFSYYGNETCATDGLCAVNCPVKIDTGKLIKKLREEKIGKHHRLADFIANNMSFVTASARSALTVIGLFQTIFGNSVMKSISGVLTTISGRKIPTWNEYIPKGAKSIKTENGNCQLPTAKYLLDEKMRRKVVYFPSCINRSMGVSKDHIEEKQLSEKIVQLLQKGGYEIIYPADLNNLCCGMAFLSKGYTEAGIKKSIELENALLQASNNGEFPVLCDMSPCLFTMKENIKPSLKLFEPVEFILDYLIQHLNIIPLAETITVFPVCSLKKMGLENKLTELAKLCADKVIVTESNCCGFAGDRGFTYPELNKHGLRNLKTQLPCTVKHGYSTSRTCETGLSLHTGISYKSIVYLVDQVSTPKKEII
jgi:D-lactate dehydrogenase